MTYQIDQSGKIEQTERHTVISCVNDSIATILLKKSEKRILQKTFKDSKNQHFFPYLTFAALLALLIKKVKPSKKIIIDREYIGHEDLIQERLIVYLKEMKADNIPVIEFGHVGKLSKAHNIAHDVAVKKIKPTLIINARETFKVIVGTKKIGYKPA